MTPQELASVRKEIIKLESPQTEQVFQLAELGIWARDVVMPLLRKLPVVTYMRLPNPDPAKQEPVVSTLEIEVGKAFACCPRK